MSIKKYRYILLVCMFFAVNAVTCYASSLNVTKCEYNATNGKVTIEGTVTDAERGQRVTLKVLNPGKQLSDLGTQDVNTVFNHIEQKIINFDTTFKFEYKMTGSSNYYIAILNTDNLVQPVTRTFSFMDLQDVINAIARLNSAECKTKEGLYAFLSQQQTQFVLSMDMQLINSLTSLDKVCGLLTAEPVAAYSSDVDFRVKLRLATILQAINDATDPTTIDELINTYNYELGLNTLKRFAVYSSNNSVRNEICEVLATKNFLKLSNFQNCFEEQVILKELYKMSSYCEVPNWIITNNDFLNLDLTIYNRLTDKAAVQKAIVAQNFADVLALKTSFNTAVLLQYNNENKAKNTSRSEGGGGGKSSVTSSVTISTTTPQELNQPESITYSDLGNYSWAKDSINKLTQLGFINGNGSDKFYPEKNVTREEFVKITVSTFGLLNNASVTTCKDVNSNEWYYKYVASAIEKNIVMGVDDSNFGVGQQITRQDMAVILNRVIQLKGKTLPLVKEKVAFADNGNISDYAKQAVDILYQAGIINGFEDGTFAPTKFSTRAESAKMIYEIYSILGGSL